MKLSRRRALEELGIEDEFAGASEGEEGAEREPRGERPSRGFGEGGGDRGPRRDAPRGGSRGGGGGGGSRGGSRGGGGGGRR